MKEPFLIPLVGQMLDEHRRVFSRMYAEALKKDPVIHAPTSHILAQIRAGDVIAALVCCEDTQAYLGAFLLAVDRPHDALVVTVCVGKELGRWGHVMDQLAHQAAEQLGLSRLWVQGRRGLQPMLKARGFKQKYVVYTKELDHEFRGRGIEGEQSERTEGRFSGDPETVSPGPMAPSAGRRANGSGIDGVSLGGDQPRATWGDGGGSGWD